MCDTMQLYTLSVLALEFSGLKFSTLKVCVVLGYSPNEGDGEVRNRFWSNMGRILDIVENGYRLCILEMYMDG